MWTNMYNTHVMANSPTLIPLNMHYFVKGGSLQITSLNALTHCITCHSREQSKELSTCTPTIIVPNLGFRAFNSHNTFSSKWHAIMLQE